MKIKISIITILLGIFLISYSQAQTIAIDSIRKCLFGDWIQMNHHHGQKFSFDTLKLTVTITNTKDSVYTYPYIIKGDSLFFIGNTEILKAAITFSDCNKFYITLEAPPQSTTCFRRKQNY